MKINLKRNFLVASTFVFTLGCEKRSQTKQKLPTELSESEQLSSEASEYDYRVVKIDDNLFLKPLFNDSEPFGPFVKNETRADRFIYYPEGRGRAKDFGSAQQIYQDTKTGAWFFTDNYLSIAARKVYFPNQPKRQATGFRASD